MPESKPGALDQLGESPTKDLASHQGLEPRPTVLETAMLPLHQRDTNMVDRRGIEPRPETCKAPVLPLSLAAHNFNALLPMRVSKNTVCDISVQVSSMLFDTLPFYTSALSPQTYHPVGRPHLQFRVMPARVAIALNEKPQGF